MLLTVLVVLVLASLIGGGIGHGRYGYVGWSPLGVVLVILGVLYFTGNLHARGF